MKIAVYGSAENASNELNGLARETGKTIARRNHILITGACPGLPYEAVLGANESRGEVWGFSPGISIEDHQTRFNFPTEGFTKWCFIPEDSPYSKQDDACKKQRNIYSAAECNAAVVISGRRGTLNEYTNACDMKKPLGILVNSGPAAILIPLAEALFQKPGGPIIYHDNPEKLIIKLEDLVSKSA
ncbi:hypothetical protein GF386_04950 [Candidatus Pacearchaeota archaeon]|nr:hypothetical protein [Candidatus Pacearchaeota archaeon]MBD3283461.1 hypothetical protein [Candidatus Pacearchaeota archaeon]